MMTRLVVYCLLLLGALGYLWWRTQPPPLLEIHVVDDRVVSYDGRTMPLDELLPALGDRIDEPGRRVRVVVDERAPSTMLIPVYQLLHDHGVDDVEVVAQPGRRP